ncbi:hypothetical protein DFP72DRAFT_1064568 [Ephemerocybe angulata]|uniref:Peptide hydrolase n=1 Tax=Ephemerocybe angulata TaxID=980116 RepID=A0A8H6I5N5_9AGAR|nr:hypothetical protein DFP72DRAFT_1064568 [Tulosesus angulatus]
MGDRRERLGASWGSFPPHQLVQRGDAELCHHHNVLPSNDTEYFTSTGTTLASNDANLSTNVVHISDGTEECKTHALLLNAHLDSTLSSPGTADDALAFGAMLQCTRFLVNTPEWSPKYAPIFPRAPPPLGA